MCLDTSRCHKTYRTKTHTSCDSHVTIASMVYSAGESTLRMVGSLIPRILPRTELVSLKRKLFPHYCKLWSISGNGWELASFPGRSHLQFLIACNMQKPRGNTRESRAWHQVDVRVDTRGQCLTKNLEVLLVISWPKTWDLILKDSINTAHYSVDSRLINTRFMSYNNRAHPLMSILTSIWHHARDSPRLPPSVWHTASDQTLEVGTAWEWG